MGVKITAGDVVFGIADHGIDLIHMQRENPELVTFHRAEVTALLRPFASEEGGAKPDTEIARGIFRDAIAVKRAFPPPAAIIVSCGPIPADDDDMIDLL